MGHMTIDRVPQDEEFAQTVEEDADSFFAPAVQSGEGDIQGPTILVLPEGISRGDAVALLSKDIGFNQYGLPEFFIRSDLLPLTAGTPITPYDIDAASVGLFYREGYPTTEAGTAFWNQLPHEPMAAFILLQKYINQAETHGIRQLELLAVEEDTELETLRQMSLEFFWSSRARAYDLFISAAEMKKRQFRTRKMESVHFDQAQSLMDGLMQKFNIGDENWWDELSVKEAIEMMDVLVKIQRLSMGLTGANASSLPKNPLPDGASPQQIMEHLTKGSSMASRDTEGFMARLDEFLSDPESGMQVQDAIIRLSRPGGGTQTSGAYQGDD
jgi:hypothetical protein